MNNSRDEFSSLVKQCLADRVASKCSNPNCKIVTKGPSNSSVSGVNNIGVAAHICAASSGGPRYDAMMTKEERSNIDNGIWLCQNCARMIDADFKKYTVKLLKEWKAKAEYLSECNLGKCSNVVYRLGDNDRNVIEEFCSIMESYGVKEVLKNHDFANTFDISFINKLLYWVNDYFDKPSIKVQNKEMVQMLEKLLNEILIFGDIIVFKGGYSHNNKSKYIIDFEEDQLKCNLLANKLWKDYETFVELYKSY